ncbi:phosphotransferase enzyme family domain-containing protein [Pochonia chlamydosporia 170]|uniref:Phosphotransferase enzyme family domain-containing protein n=1 Tax=Pochonia chlamydosporia 170 TaxID=1380566 RepID=A0A179FSS9_METCM|nr:phosphotransferase enzyme family domain-containing protein [Pochonia chlamydosporia 170]OAQ68191.1 phosphotransferase enzyme family domain-containing protein [Pochonia chlamydosporia 170]
MPTTFTLPPENEIIPAVQAQLTFRKEADSFRLRREAEAMEYIRSRTPIPIPSILDMHIDINDDQPGWILMERIPGRQLDDAWPTMTETAKARCISELQSYLHQLHSLRPPGSGWIGSCSGGPAYDHRLDNMTTCGPFATIPEFNDFLVAPVKNCPRQEWVAKYRNMLRDDYSIIFAHADLSGENILVDPTNGCVTGIVDREMAGFWPE